MTCMRKYFVYDGRTTREEYWGFIIVKYGIMLLYFGISKVFFSAMDESLMLSEQSRRIFGSVYMIIFIGFYVLTLLPGISAQVRRLHDSNKSGAWWFIQMVPYLGLAVMFILLIIPGTDGENRYGSDPYYEEEIQEASVE